MDARIRYSFFISLSLIVLALITILFQGFFFPWENIPSGDIVGQAYPYLIAVKRTIHEIPYRLWFPELCAGVPGVGDINTSLLNPIYQLLRFFEVQSVLKFEFFLAIFIGFWGQYCLSKEYFSTKASILCALLFIFSMPIISVLVMGHTIFIWGNIIWPWIIYFIKRFSQGKKHDVINSVFWMSLIFALLWLTTHPQITVLFCEFMIFFLLFWIKKYHHKFFTPRLLLIPIVVVFGSLIALPQIMSTLNIIDETLRSHMGDSLAYKTQGSLNPINVLKSLFPNLYGSQSSYWGQSGYWDGQLFAGALCLYFFILGFKKLEGIYKFTIIFAFLLALGHYTPIYTLNQSIFPGSSLFRYPTRSLVVITPIISMGVIYGCQNLTLQFKGFAKWLCITFFVTLALIMVIDTFSINQVYQLILPNHVFERYILNQHMQGNTSIYFIFFITQLLIFFFIYIQKFKLLTISFGIIFLILTPLSINYSLSTVPSSISHNDKGETGRIFVKQYNSQYNAPLIWGYHSINGYSPTINGQYRIFMDTLQKQNWMKGNRIQPPPLSDELIQFFNIKLTVDEIINHAEPINIQTANEIDSTEFYIPMNFHVLNLRKESEHSQLIIEHQEKLQNKFENLYKAKFSKPENYSIEIIKQNPHYIEMNVETDKPIILVSSRTNSKIWKLNVNEKPSDIVKWYNCFQATFLDSGNHKVKFYIDDTNFKTQLLISCFSFIILMISYIYISRRVTSP